MIATEDEWVGARARARRGDVRSALVGLVLVAALGFPAVYLADLTASGVARYPVTAGWLALLMAPVVLTLARRGLKEQAETDAVVEALTRQLTDAVQAAGREVAEREVQSRTQKFESRLANALDMAEGEPEVIDVIERSFSSIVPGAPVELLLADHSHAHLLRMAGAPVSGATSGCRVDSPDHCPAARRAQVQRFTDSDELDACPKLRGRPEGAVSALCVPVSIMGRTVGIIHATTRQHQAFAETAASDMATLAKLSGARIGMLRVMAEVQLQAATDSLTGLLNRRSFEQRFSLMSRQAGGICVVMADLDQFKSLNDTYGHETGDRALRLFAQVLSESVRAKDLVSRHGGEEFALALSGCRTEQAREILDALSERLEAAVTVAGLPQFTASFGLVEAGRQEGLAGILARADAALFQAKHEGRGRIVVHDAAGHCEPVPERSAESDGLALVRLLHRRDPVELTDGP